MLTGNLLPGATVNVAPETHPFIPPLSELVSPQAFSETTEAAQNAALQGAATTLDSRFWNSLAQSSETEQGLSAEEGQTLLEAQVMTGNLLPGQDIDLNAIADGVETDQNTASQPVLSTNDLNAIAGGVEADQNTAAQPNAADQNTTDLNAAAGGNPYDCDTTCQQLEKQALQQQQAQQPTPQQLKAQALQNQIYGLKSAFSRFLANPTDPRTCKHWPIRRKAWLRKGVHSSNSQIQQLAGQLGGLAQAGDHYASTVVGSVNGICHADGNGGISQSLNILSGIINKK